MRLPDPVEPAEEEELFGAASAEEEAAYARALKALGHKERTVAELEGWLREREYGERAVAAVIERLEAAGALGDREFAARYAEDKRRLARWGAERIRQTLLDRGVPAAFAEAAVAEDDPEAERERAREALGERTFHLSEERDRQRALAFLARKGYRHEVAYEAIRGTG